MIRSLWTTTATFKDSLKCMSPCLKNTNHKVRKIVELVQHLEIISNQKAEPNITSFLWNFIFFPFVFHIKSQCLQ